MHVLDANEIFWMTFYTYDRIIEEGGNYWPDALALYIKLIKQTRIQQTNQTYSLDSFLENWLGWGYKRLKNAKNVLKSLGLIDNLDIRDKSGKITWHYVRVNFLINENKVRTSSTTYNLTTTAPEPVMAENQNWSNEHKCLNNTNINALNTKKEINNNLENWENLWNWELVSYPINELKEKEKSSAKKEKESMKEITLEINDLIWKLKDICNQYWVAYDNTKDRMFAKHILTAKDYWEFCEKNNQDRVTFACNVLLASIKINYWKGALSWPMKIYQNYPDLYNQTKQKAAKTYTPTIQVL